MRYYLQLNLAFLFCVFFANPTLANESLTFQAIETDKQKRITDYVSEQIDVTLNFANIASKDLNDDVIDEFILQYDCGSNNLCRHVIVALEELEPVIIGQFDAHKILISNKKTYGIRDLVVYNNVHNDFQNQIARWNPFSFTYQLD